MTPIKFEYVDKFSKAKIYLSILYQFKHHYTGKTVYHVREESECGYVGENLYDEDAIHELLKNRVEEN